MIGSRTVAYVFDVDPLTGYARQKSLVVPSLVAAAVDRDRAIAVSALVLADAYRQLTEDHALVLEVLTGGQLAAVFSVEPFDATAARALARRHGKVAELTDEATLSTLHTAQLAKQFKAGVVTGSPGPVRALLGRDWPILKPW